MPGRGQPWKEGGHNDDTIVSADIKDLTVVNADVAVGTLWGNRLDIFQSTEITGTGAEQDIAHGLGRTPSLVWWSISLQGNTDTIVQGTHDGTNVKLNFPATTKVFVFAL